MGIDHAMVFWSNGKNTHKRNTTHIVVIGAGIGGLTAGAMLAKAGFQVTVLEAHIYPGGCAGTFYHQGYHFDAGATLAGGFYPGGPMDIVAAALAYRTGAPILLTLLFWSICLTARPLLGGPTTGVGRNRNRCRALLPYL